MVPLTGSVGHLLEAVDAESFLSQLSTLHTALGGFIDSLRSAGTQQQKDEAKEAKEKEKEDAEVRHKWTAEENMKLLMERSAGRSFKLIGKEYGMLAKKVRAHYNSLMLKQKAQDEAKDAAAATAAPKTPLKSAAAAVGKSGASATKAKKAAAPVAATADDSSSSDSESSGSESD